ncbi:hypothetical protein FRC17_004904 [Serendipita sp. 399]|nr:hypothetical protein FRC17_004904 [Serendipita sp. 399]
MRFQSTLVFFGLAPLLVAASGEGYKRPAGLIKRSTAYKAIPRTLQEGVPSRKKRQETCAADETACGTGCCITGSTCVDETTGTCCPAEEPNCAETPTTCTDATYVACADFDFCCPPGETCSVDEAGEPQCGDGTGATVTETDSEPGVTSSTRPVAGVTTTRTSTTRVSSSTSRASSSPSSTATNTSAPNGAVGLQVGGSAAAVVAAVMAVVAAASL